MKLTKVFILATAVLLGVSLVSSCEKDTNDNTATTNNGGGDNPGGGGDNPGNIPDVQGFDAVGASYALFSVSPTTQVRFSRGNLQYQASTDTWRFAEHQFDYVGEGNANISPTYDGWIDLFGWGTSGWPSGATCYQPWSTSWELVEYNVGGWDTNDLVDECANADWGIYNAISNGGNQAGMWRTLTCSEWRYLIAERTDAALKYGPATIGNIRGVVFLPDDWTQPEGITFIPGEGEEHSNEMTYEQWSQMEAAGAIFLPPAGCRSENRTLFDIGDEGYYWSSTRRRGEWAAYGIWVYSTGCSYILQPKRREGISVRLVRR